MQVAKPGKRNQNDVIEQMMVNVILRIQRRQWQPGERGRKMTGADVVPQESRPLDVIVPVVIAATDRRGRILKPPKNQQDSDCPHQKIRGAYGTFGFQPATAPLVRSFCGGW